MNKKGYDENGLYFNPEDGGSTVFRNVAIQLPHYTLHQSRKQHILRMYLFLGDLMKSFQLPILYIV
jgi:hypothetical protein